MKRQIGNFLYEEFDEDKAILKRNANKKVAIGGSIRPNLVKKVVIVAKINPYDIIGSEEVMLESDKRFISALCQSNKAKFFRIHKNDFVFLKLNNSAGNVIAESIGDRLNTLAQTKLSSLKMKISNLKDVTENMRNKTTKKLPSEDQKLLTEVKFKIDREYEKVFLKQMTKMKIIKQSKAIKDINRNNKDFPITNFYNQLIKEERILKPYNEVRAQDSLERPSKMRSNLQHLFH